MLVAAVDGYAGCELFAFANRINGRTDEIGCPVFSPSMPFTLTVATIWLIPNLVDSWGWRTVFITLTPGPALGTLAMRRLPRVAAPQGARA